MLKIVACGGELRAQQFEQQFFDLAHNNESGLGHRVCARMLERKQRIHIRVRAIGRLSWWEVSSWRPTRPLRLSAALAVRGQAPGACMPEAVCRHTSFAHDISSSR